tara:strand:- start:734 stop:940 length:207 start_codon:yes stop_codon:yes gene_type:complete
MKIGQDIDKENKMYTNELNEIWYALHTNIEAEEYKRWDDLCTAMAFIEQALGHENFQAEDPIDLNKEN